MLTVYYIIIGFHVAVAVALIAFVLLQTGKGAGLSGVFGAGGAATESFFGGRGPGTFLTKLTTVSAIVFMLTSLVLAKLSSVPKGGKSIMDKAKTTATTPAKPHRAPVRRPSSR
jgi:preprotein translocase subunit SecG